MKDRFFLEEMLQQEEVPPMAKFMNSYFNELDACKIDMNSSNLQNALVENLVCLNNLECNQRIKLVEHWKNTDKNNFEFIQKMIEEGLIKSYPTKFFMRKIDEQCKKFIIQKTFFRNDFLPSRRYDFKIAGKCTREDDEEVSPSVNLECVVKSKDKQKLADQVLAICRTCGYGVSHVNWYKHESRNGIELVIFVFESLYSSYETHLNETLMHVAPISVLNKIAKNGLVPSESKNGKFSYEPRVYLFNYATFDQVCRFANLRGYNNKCFCVFKLKKDKLLNDQLYKSGKLKFYVDPMTVVGNSKDNLAIFTHGNIPPRLLEDEFVVIDPTNNSKSIKSLKTIKKK